MVSIDSHFSFLSWFCWLLLRSILHDPKTFNNPMEYQPERYLKDGKLNPDVLDPDSVAFGFGRRSVDLPYSVMRAISHRRSTPLSICPGKYLGDNSLYILACCLLAVYDIKPPVDDQGNTIKLKAEFTGGLLSWAWPYEYDCRLLDSKLTGIPLLSSVPSSLEVLWPKR